MLLTITTTHHPATDLGYLLFKHPDRVQSFPLTFGQAHVFYPQATEARCTAALLLDINPVELVRGKGGDSFALAQYVNDRPYVASSFLAVAMAEVYGTAMTGRDPKDKPGLATTPLPLEITISTLPARGGAAQIEKLFAPLGYTVEVQSEVLDSQFAEWGASPYHNVTLRHTLPLKTVLAHLYILIPTLDGKKHYYVAGDEVNKLVRYGEGWLNSHPEKEYITTRYLKYQRDLKQEALARLAEGDLPTDADEEDRVVEHNAEEKVLEEKISLHTQRLNSVLAVLRASGARRVVDLGCGEGRLLRLLLSEPYFQEIVGLDVAHRTLQIAAERLKLDRLPPPQRQRITLLHGSLMYRDPRIEGYDAAAVVEVIEHLDPPRLFAFQRVLFEFAQPRTVVVTTPNAAYNVMWESLPAGQFRHKDHRFEWTHGEFQAWATDMATRYYYKVRFLPIGEEDAKVGAPSQMAIFDRIQ